LISSSVLQSNALRGGRPRFQTAQTDLDAACVAVAVVFLVYAFDRFIDLLDELALAITLCAVRC
jgi:hypothetical protein